MLTEVWRLRTKCSANKFHISLLPQSCTLSGPAGCHSGSPL